jgi:hypothetical protein
MPFKSRAQQAYFNANRTKMERQGIDVDEWNSASKGMKLPKRAKGKDKKSGWASLANLGAK